MTVCLPSFLHFPGPCPPVPPPQGPSVITKVNLLFKGVVCGVSSVSSSRIHLSEAALLRGLEGTFLFLDILSCCVLAGHGFNHLYLWGVAGQSGQGREGRRRKGRRCPTFQWEHSSLKLSFCSGEHLKNTSVY